MAIKKPLVLTAGQPQQVQPTDVIDPVALGTGAASSSTFLRGDSVWATPAGGGGGASATRAVINASFPASRNKRVNVADAAVGVGSKVMAWVSGIADGQPNSGDLVDLRSIRAIAKSGSFDLDLDFLTPWAGSLSIDYVVFA